MAVLRALQIVVLGLWVGVGLFFSFVVAPQVFRLFTGVMTQQPPEGMPRLDERVARRFAGETVGMVFPWYFGLQATLGLAALVLTGVLAWTQTGNRWLWAETLLIVLALLSLAVQLLWVYPASERVLDQIHRLEASQNFADADALRRQFNMWHGISQLCNLVTVAAATLAFFLLAWELSVQPGTASTTPQSEVRRLTNGIT